MVQEQDKSVSTIAGRLFGLLGLGVAVTSFVLLWRIYRAVTAEE